MIQAAACIGREFGAGILAEALPMGAAELEDALGQLPGAQSPFRPVCAAGAPPPLYPARVP